MLEPIADLPANVIGVVAKGEIVADDYRDTLVPAIEAALKDTDKVRFLYVLGPDYEGFSAGAMWEDGKLGLEHLTSWDKIAVVSDKDWVRHSVNAFGYLLPGKVKVFTLDEQEETATWAAA